LYSEKLAQMPLTFQPNGRWRPPPQPMSRRAAGLPEDAFVMCAFNHTYKIGPEAFDIWCSVMRDVPRAVLWLKETNGQLHDNVRREAAARGVDPQRILFARTVDYADHFSRLALADVFVDTWPYNAHTTAADALWAGVPVVTLIQNSFASRVAASVLNAAGLAELAFETAQDYRCAIAALALDSALLAGYRQHLKNPAALALFDGQRYTREFESLLAAHVVALVRRPARRSPARRCRAAPPADPCLNGTAMDATNACATDPDAPAAPVESWTVHLASGLALQVPASLRSLTTYVLLEQETWFEPEMSLLPLLLEPGMHALDIGANHGIYALEIARCTGTRSCLGLRTDLGALAPAAGQRQGQRPARAHHGGRRGPGRRRRRGQLRPAGQQRAQLARRRWRPARNRAPAVLGPLPGLPCAGPAHRIRQARRRGRRGERAGRRAALLRHAVAGGDVRVQARCQPEHAAASGLAGAGLRAVSLECRAGACCCRSMRRPASWTSR
jgi:hypothetical protein